MKIFLNFSNNRILFHATVVPERFSDMVIGGVKYNVRKVLYHCNHHIEEEAVTLNYADVFLDKEKSDRIDPIQELANKTEFPFVREGVKVNPPQSYYSPYLHNY